MFTWNFSIKFRNVFFCYQRLLFRSHRIPKTVIHFICFAFLSKHRSPLQEFIFKGIGGELNWIYRKALESATREKFRRNSFPLFAREIPFHRHSLTASSSFVRREHDRMLSQSEFESIFHFVKTTKIFWIKFPLPSPVCSQPTLNIINKQEKHLIYFYICNFIK